ncbi:TetR/AcrR family transcriptional regulator [Butyrivibrio sp. NC2002]|uniref:TetR/AcrR family transcriptional regulator n=1 Tax=Butyrivibrio sp. NC2002 TaxID=1410610 RepID=UPI00068F9BF8|nr:TetR/AcrR family transcriptional regulator [Butyrivibrio sp. NC2002]
MNEKFFDLKKEKQDRIINASLKAFALGGYMHASTDDIVKMAGISKGLIFHYFDTKLGLYQFIYDYSTRVILLEMTTGVSKDVTDFFTLREQIERAVSLCMQQYPYIQLFLYGAAVEDVPEAASAILPSRESYERIMEGVLERSDITRFKPGANYELMGNVIDMTRKGLLERMFQEGVFQPEAYYEESIRYMEMMRELSYD